MSNSLWGRETVVALGQEFVQVVAVGSVLLLPLQGAVPSVRLPGNYSVSSRHITN